MPQRRGPKKPKSLKTWSFLSVKTLKRTGEILLFFFRHFGVEMISFFEECQCWSYVIYFLEVKSLGRFLCDPPRGIMEGQEPPAHIKVGVNSGRMEPFCHGNGEKNMLPDPPKPRTQKDQCQLKVLCKLYLKKLSSNRTSGVTEFHS